MRCWKGSALSAAKSSGGSCQLSTSRLPLQSMAAEGRLVDSTLAAAMQGSSQSSAWTSSGERKAPTSPARYITRPHTQTKAAHSLDAGG